MAGDPIAIRLRCRTWAHLASLYQKDLKRQAVFLRSNSRPAIGTRVEIKLTLPSETVVEFTGAIAKHLAEGELGGRGPGLDVALDEIPSNTMWLIESALASQQRFKKERAQSIPADDVSVEEGQAIVAAEREVISAMRSELEGMRKRSPHQVLGIPIDAKQATVRNAFSELTKKYHPDSHARYQSPQIRDLSAEIFILIRNAYERLSDTRSGSQRPHLAVTAREPSQGGPPPPQPPAEEAKPPRGKKISSKRTRGLTEAELFGDEDTSLEDNPVELRASPVEFTADFLRADALCDAGKFDEAKAIFSLVSRKDPTNVRARAGMELVEGLRALAERDRMEAAQRFEATLDLDPTNERAARELAEMRRLATNQRKGLLSRLLGGGEE